MSDDYFNLGRYEKLLLQVEEWSRIEPTYKREVGNHKVVRLIEDQEKRTVFRQLQNGEQLATIYGAGLSRVTYALHYDFTYTLTAVDHAGNLVHHVKINKDGGLDRGGEDNPEYLEVMG